MDKLLNVLPLIVVLISATVYAENKYAKQDNIDQSIQAIQIERYQDKINYLRFKEKQGNITPDQRWELDYYKDKRENLLKGK